MSERAKRYFRAKFCNWKKRVNQHLPSMAVSFYQFKMSGGEIDSDKEKTLGFVIRELNNPYYSLVGDTGRPLDDENRMASEVILEIMVNEIFSYIKRLTP